MRGNEVAGSLAPGAAGALLGLRSQYTIFRKKHERLGEKSGEAEASEILDHEPSIEDGSRKKSVPERHCTRNMVTISCRELCAMAAGTE